MTDRGDESPLGDVGTLDVLAPEECWELLATGVVGRLAVIAADGLPFVAPVNYVLDGETVVFCTDYGMKYDALLRHPVAFQADSIDTGTRTGWTVLVQGVAHEATPHEAEHLGVEPWAGSKQHWVRIVSRHISGRRIRRADS